MKKLLSILSIAFFLTGCGSGAVTSLVGGSISAPGGSFAFNPPGKIEQFFASLIGSPAVAKIDGLASVGSGVTVNLIEIDADGNQVGDVIATATTDSAGTYSLSVPTSYSAAAKYAIVGTGTSDTIKSMWEGSTVDVDPGSYATMEALLDAATDLSTLDTKEIISARELIEDFTENLSTSESSNVTNYTASLKAALQNDSEAAKMLSNKTAAGEVCGTVTNVSDNPVDNIRIFARDFSDFSKMAKTKTAADGSYCFNAPVGQELMVGAINRTTTSYAASEFYTTASPAGAFCSDSSYTDETACTDNSETWTTKCHLVHCADKLTVTTDTTANFKLVQGGRITGTITGDGNALKKVKVLFRNALTKKPAGATKTNKDGVYTMNLALEDDSYIVYFKNSTKKAFGSTAFTTNTTYYDSGQAVDRNFAEKLTLTAGSTLTADAVLLAGGTLTGTITDNNGDPVEFAKLRIDQIKDKDNIVVDLQADRFHTNKLGVYRVQLPYGTYTISARGEFKDGVSNAGYTLDSSNLEHTIDFTHQTSAITFKLTDSSNPAIAIGSVTAKLRNVGNGKTTGNPTVSDGTTTLYVPHVPPNNDYYFSVTVNNGTNNASCNWNGTSCDKATPQNQSNAVTISADDAATFENIILPPGFPISGTVRDTNGSLLPNVKVQARVEVNGNWKAYATTKTGGNGQYYTLTIPAEQAYQIWGYVNPNFKAKYKGTGGTAGCTIITPSSVNFNEGYCSVNTYMDKTTCEANSDTWTSRSADYTIGGTPDGDNGGSNTNNICPW